MNNNGQVSIEFIITIVFIISILIFSIFLFQNRFFLNQVYSQQWEASNMATRFSRNVNVVALLDENAIFSDYFFWNDNEKYFEIDDNIIIFYYSGGFFVDSRVLTFVDSRISDLNGQIFFKKTIDGVLITYE
jgi:uncharacterized protein (UPF0333 family)